MKKIIAVLICLGIFALSIYKMDDISNYVVNQFLMTNHLIIRSANEYEKEDVVSYVKETKDYVPYSFQDLKDIIYTAINKGWDEFTFYCASEYESCVSDIEYMTKDEEILTHINNIVHPYNSFTNIKTTISESGEITLNIYYLYSKEEIEAINKKANELLENLKIKDIDNDYDKIKTIHDYIINNTVYDVERNKTGESNYKSYTAYGLFFDSTATCSGYTDAMAILLEMLDIPNFKVVTSAENIAENEKGHIWNAVYVDGKWLHLDLTWDDPVSTNKQNYLYHTYFLITTEEMEKSDNGNVKLNEHKFDKTVYIELK